MVADHWFMQIEKVLEAMEITSDDQDQASCVLARGRGPSMVDMG